MEEDLRNNQLSSGWGGQSRGVLGTCESTNWGQSNIGDQCEALVRIPWTGSRSKCYWVSYLISESSSGGEGEEGWGSHGSGDERGIAQAEK